MGYISDLRKLVGHRTLIMPCACLIIGDGKGNILLQQRADDGQWGYHGGAIEVDEAVEEALKREIKEELNIELDEIQLFGVYSGAAYHHVYPNGDEVSPIDIVYFCHKFHGEIMLQKEEVLGLQWFNRHNLPENLRDSFKQPILDYLSKFE